MAARSAPYVSATLTRYGPIHGLGASAVVMVVVGKKLDQTRSRRDVDMST